MQKFRPVGRLYCRCRSKTFGEYESSQQGGDFLVDRRDDGQAYGRDRQTERQAASWPAGFWTKRSTLLTRGAILQLRTRRSEDENNLAAAPYWASLANDRHGKSKLAAMFPSRAEPSPPLSDGNDLFRFSVSGFRAAPRAFYEYSYANANDRHLQYKNWLCG